MKWRGSKLKVNRKPPSQMPGSLYQELLGQPGTIGRSQTVPPPRSCVRHRGTSDQIVK